MNPISGGGLKKSIFHAVCLEMMIMDFFLRRVAQEKYQAEIRGFSSESRWFELRKKWKNHEETQQMGTVNAGAPAISIDLLNTYHHVWGLNPDDS